MIALNILLGVIIAWGWGFMGMMSHIILWEFELVEHGDVLPTDHTNKLHLLISLATWIAWPVLWIGLIVWGLIKLVAWLCKAPKLFYKFWTALDDLPKEKPKKAP